MIVVLPFTAGFMVMLGLAHARDGDTVSAVMCFATGAIALGAGLVFAGIVSFN